MLENARFKFSGEITMFHKLVEDHSLIDHLLGQARLYNRMSFLQLVTNKLEQDAHL